MNPIFTFHYDEKLDLHKFQSLINSSISVIYISGLAMKELLGSHKFGVITQNDIGTAIEEYLSSNGINSTKENPLFIFSEQETAPANHALAVTVELKKLCEGYINK